VTLPFYALRWAPGPGGMTRLQPDGLQAGALVSVLPGQVDHINPEDLVRAAAGLKWRAQGQPAVLDRTTRVVGLCVLRTIRGYADY